MPGLVETDPRRVRQLRQRNLDPGGFNCHTATARLYHASAVLPDGRVIIEGGEYNFLQAVWTNLGAIYDPVTNTWTSVAPPTFLGFGPFPRTIGDAQGVVLFDGMFMQANCCTPRHGSAQC